MRDDEKAEGNSRPFERASRSHVGELSVPFCTDVKEPADEKDDPFAGMLLPPAGNPLASGEVQQPHSLVLGMSNGCVLSKSVLGSAESDKTRFAKMGEGSRGSSTRADIEYRRDTPRHVRA